MTGSNIPNVEETNTQILSDIQNLQSFEQELFSNLEENPALTQQEQQTIIQKINQVSDMRLNLYKTLNGVTGYFQNSLYNSQGTLEEQITAIDIVEQELNKAKQKLKILEEEKNNKIRLVEINTYYGEKYQEHAELMKIIIFTLIPIIILAILYNKGFIPQIIYYSLLLIIAAIGSYFMWFRLASIWNRDNMNYQEYNWPVYVAPPKVKKTSKHKSGDPWANGVNVTGSLSVGCVDQYCCAPGTVYDGSLNQCVIPALGSSSTSAPSSSSTPAPSSSSSSSSTPAATSSAGNVLNTTESNIGSIYSSGVNDLQTGSSNLFNSMSSALGGTESFANLKESFTKHSRFAKKPSATLNSTYAPKMAESFIYK